MIFINYVQLCLYHVQEMSRKCSTGTKNETNFWFFSFQGPKLKFVIFLTAEKINLLNIFDKFSLSKKK